jgi:hypothetical protein
MPGKIFINYRRGDDPGFTQALYQRLEDEFATGNLFMDVEGHIKPGDDFVEVLNTQVAEADVVLAVIGPRWAELMMARAGDPDDFVAIEIKAALDQGKRIVPVLVGGASIPRADTLPEAIRALARRNAVGLRPERFKADCQGLITSLKESLAAAGQERAAQTEKERKAAQTARRDSEEQAAARARFVEERSRARAAAGLSADEIRKAEELASWDFVKDRNGIQDLRDHLARFPGGTTERYALSKLDKLVYAALGLFPKIDQLCAYLDEFPEGASAAAAKSRIAALEKEAADASAAKQRQVQEIAEWVAVAASIDPAPIEVFLSKWPDGNYSNAARTRIAELRRKPSGMRLAVLFAVLVLVSAVFFVFFFDMLGSPGPAKVLSDASPFKGMTPAAARPPPSEPVEPRGQAITVSVRMGSLPGDAKKAWLGVNAEPLAHVLGLAHANGALVFNKTPGGPADQGGIRAGDVILGIDGTSIANSGELRQRVAAEVPGSLTLVDVWRAAGDEGNFLQLMRRLADGGDGSAMYHLGRMYAGGIGTSRDDAEAARWFRKGAESGNRDAAAALAIALLEGRGVVKDQS